MNIDFSSISSKVNKYIASDDGKKKIQQKMSELRSGHGGSKTSGGSIVLTYDQMQDAAKELIALIRRHAASAGLPPSVMVHVESFEDSKIIVKGDGSAEISINMMDDPKRPSLLPEDFDGVENIVAIFNRGVHAQGAVYGYWASAGKDVWSQGTRPALHFMESAINEFNMKYGGKYDVTVTLNAQYTHSGS